jgi:hypothetical protein
MDIWQRWKQTTIANKALVLTGAAVAVGTLVSTSALVVQVCITRENNRKTSEQVGKLIESANIQAGAAQSFAKTSKEQALRMGDLSELAKQVAKHQLGQK